MRRCTNKRGRRAFTLLETLLALGLAATLIGGVYAIASGTTQLSSEISRSREREMTEQAFLSLSRESLKGLSPSADLKLRASPTGGRPLSELVISGDPTAFAFSGVPAGSTAVILSSEPDADGLLAVKLTYLDEGDIAAFDRGRRDVGRELGLLKGIRQFDWRFFDRRGDRWNSAWEIRSGRPALAELTLAFDGNSPTRHVFLIPELHPPPLPIPRPIREKPIDNDN